MLFARFHALAARRRTAVRRVAMTHLPQVEAMEGRQLLTAIPYITISSPKITEGTGTTSNVSFTVNMTSAATSPVVMNYQSVNKSAVAGSDFLGTSGTLTFAPGETVKLISVPVIGDSAPELTEAFGMLLSNVQNGILVGSLGIATILDNDAVVAPKLTVNDVLMTRGFGGSKTMVFTVSLNTTVKTPVTVNVATSNLTALNGRDYSAMSQLLTFNPGETSKLVSITIYGTETATSDKIFFLKLTGANVAVARASGAGIIKYGV